MSSRTIQGDFASAVAQQANRLNPTDDPSPFKGLSINFIGSEVMLILSTDGGGINFTTIALGDKTKAEDDLIRFMRQVIDSETPVVPGSQEALTGFFFLLDDRINQLVGDPENPRMAPELPFWSDKQGKKLRGRYLSADFEGDRVTIVFHQYDGSISKPFISNFFRSIEDLLTAFSDFVEGQHQIWMEQLGAAVSEAVAEVKAVLPPSVETN